MNPHLARNGRAMAPVYLYLVVVLHLNIDQYLARADGAVAVADHGDLLRLGQRGGDLSSYFGQHLHKITFRTFSKGSRTNSIDRL